MSFDPNKINSDQSAADQENLWAVEAEEMPRQHVDLQTQEYTDKFAQAEVYAKKTKVNAVEITAEGLASGAYDGYDVHLDDNGDYVLDTYVMKQNDDGTRERVYETTKKVVPGQWILTNPSQVEGDYPNNYAVDGDKFQKRYEPTNQDGVYRAKGMARIIRNDVGAPVEITAPWGDSQEGDANCYFAVTYNPDDPDEISGDRYILSENDFATYGLASEVLGEQVRAVK